MKFYVHPYRPDSAGAKKLIAALGGEVLGTNKPAKDDLVICWGAGGARLPAGALNAKINDVINKYDFLMRLKDTDFIPDFRTTRVGAASLNFPVFCRTTLEGKDGEGIVIAENVGQLVAASLYVEYFKKTSEYRVHVGRFADGSLTVIGSQKKTFDGTGDARIWAGDGAHLSDEWDTAPAAVTTAVIGAFKKFPELTFAGFDVLYNSATDTAVVIEGNTAPMMTPTTTKRYAAFFRDYVSRRDGKPLELTEKVKETPEVAPIIDVAPGSPTPAWASGVKAAAPTRENVMWLLEHGMVKLETVVDGYIQTIKPKQ